jgi:hypothetical protein
MKRSDTRSSNSDPRDDSDNRRRLITMIGLDRSGPAPHSSKVDQQMTHEWITRPTFWPAGSPASQKDRYSPTRVSCSIIGGSASHPARRSSWKVPTAAMPGSGFSVFSWSSSNMTKVSPSPHPVRAIADPFWSFVLDRREHVVAELGYGGAMAAACSMSVSTFAAAPRIDNQRCAS